MNVPTATHVLAHELFQSYMRGWKDGCSARAQRRDFTEHPTRPDLCTEYKRGYDDGYRDRVERQRAAAERLGYRPTVLRASFQTDEEGVSAGT
jgi:hypothetical protein